jgi:hypothetical protein
MEYSEFLGNKRKSVIKSGFEVKEFKCKTLREDQKFVIKKGLQSGRFAFFQDCGLGKTVEQLECAWQVLQYTNKPVLILTLLAVVDQTMDIEAPKFGFEIYKLKQNSIVEPKIYITNYDQLENIDSSLFECIILDESSKLKNVDGKTRNLLVEKFLKTPYKFCFTATPSPNDHMELGNHSEFLGHMSYGEMLAMFFVHDGGETSKWRLRKHAENDFWDYVLSWSIAETTPKSLGFDIDGFDLPEINFIEHFIDVEGENLNLFGESEVSATELHADLRSTINERVLKCKEIVSEIPNVQWLIWGLGNAETDLIAKTIDGCVNVQGSNTPEIKAKNLNAFATGEIKDMVTKAKIAGFGMNYQNCYNMIFSSYDFGFELFYQAIRRAYRFGNPYSVNVHLIIPRTQINVRSSILLKMKKHKEMMEKLAQKCFIYQKKEAEFVKNEDVKTSDYWLMNGDCVEKSKLIPDNAADVCVFSPPFSELYVYSDKIEDMGNSKDYTEFETHFKYLIPEIKRVLKSGRICAVHCMDLPIQKGKEGYIGLRDFSGMLVDWFTEKGFIYHAKVTIWKNPVTEMQRTKALGLLHKTIKKDSVMSRVGIPDYVLFFRNEGENEVPIRHQDIDQSRPDYLPVDLWQKYASPVWMDVNYSRTLQYTTARDSNDEKHICPLQLDTIERILHLYSNEGETVFSPFGGIGSEGFQSLKMNRKSISIELKESYFKVNVQNHKNAALKGTLELVF